MVDLHHHLLFGVDDGAQDLRASVAMVEMAVNDGVTHIVATPHANSEYRYHRASHAARLQAIRNALPPAIASRITLGLGCDFHLDYENTEAIREDKARFQINDGPYLLIELSDHAIPQRVDELLYELRVLGLVPILTHPERNATLQRSRTRLRTWIEADLLVQITAGSVTGTFGKKAQRVAWELLENRWVTFVSSDAHNLERRSPRLSEAYAAVAKRLGDDTADRLFTTNPLAVFEGRALSQQPSPRGVFEDDDFKPWWKAMLARFR